MRNLVFTNRKSINHMSDIHLELAKMEDSKDVWEWRNHPVVLANSFNSNVISWKEHRHWFSKKIIDDQSKIYIAQYQNKKIGVMRFDQEDKRVIVSINLNPQYFGKGFGTLLIKKGTNKFIGEMKCDKPIVARIKTENIRSIKAFTNAGYRLMNKRDQEVIYQFSEKN